MGKIIKLSTAKNKYKIPKCNLQNAILEGRIHLINEDSIDILEIESEYLKDSEAIPIERIIEDISLRESFFLSEGNLSFLKKDIVKYQNWGIDFRTSNVLLTEKPSRDTIYIWDYKEERKVIIAWILKHLDILPPAANYTKLWELIDKQTELVLQKTLECSPKVINEKNLSFQYKFISRIIMEKKHLDKWEVADCQKFIRKYNDHKSKSYLKRLMENAKNKKVNDFFKQIILEYAPCKKDEKHYTVSQYISLGSLLFHPAYFISEGIIERAINNSLCAQAVLYMAMTIVSAWRMGDLLKINVANEFDIEKAINRLKNGDLPYDISNPVWFGFRLFYMNYENANKNKGNLYISSSIELGKVAGLYLIIAEYHRIREHRENLLEVSEFNKISVFKEALGERCYEEILGKEMFREKYMNKAFLDLYAEETSDKFKVMRFKSLPVMLAAYLRGHKIDLKRGQKVIFHYINFASEGMTLDEVLLELFKVGNFGFYMHKVLTILEGDFNYHGLAEKASILAAININPEDFEKQLEKYTCVLDSISRLEELPKSVTELMRSKIFSSVINETANGKEENVFCLYRALTGIRPKGCRKGKYCTGCDKDLAYGKFCKFAIYSYEYVYNLTLRIAKYEERMRLLKEEFKKAEKENNREMAKIYNDLYELERRRKTNTENIQEEFILSTGISDTFRKTLINLAYGEETE